MKNKIKAILLLFSTVLITACSVSEPQDPSISAVRKTITKTSISNRKIETVKLEGGTAVLIDSLGAYWVKNGVVYAANGQAKAWSPSIKYTFNSKISHSSIEKAVKQK